MAIEKLNLFQIWINEKLNEIEKTLSSIDENKLSIMTSFEVEKAANEMISIYNIFTNFNQNWKIDIYVWWVKDTLKKILQNTMNIVTLFWIIIENEKTDRIEYPINVFNMFIEKVKKSWINPRNKLKDSKIAISIIKWEWNFQNIEKIKNFISAISTLIYDNAYFIKYYKDNWNINIDEALEILNEEQTNYINKLIDKLNSSAYQWLLWVWVNYLLNAYDREKLAELDKSNEWQFLVGEEYANLVTEYLIFEYENFWETSKQAVKNIANFITDKANEYWKSVWGIYYLIKPFDISPFISFRYIKKPHVTLFDNSTEEYKFFKENIENYYDNLNKNEKEKFKLFLGKFIKSQSWKQKLYKEFMEFVNKNNLWNIIFWTTYKSEWNSDKIYEKYIELLTSMLNWLK